MCLVGTHRIVVYRHTGFHHFLEHYKNMALYLRKRLENKAEIAVWHVTETEEELLNLTSVPSDELEEISLFRS